ncbi:MAG: hypothetical protein K8F36_09895 [Melioribacteraceae bacterium]|nr:hypothetical protein [Melioribacteraceae bacterium]
MNKQRSALLNFYFSFKPITDKEEYVELFEAHNIDKKLINEKKAKLLKKVGANLRIIEGEKFSEKMREVLDGIKNKTLSVKDLGLSEEARKDFEYAYNNFSGNEEELFEDKIKDQTRLEVIEKIKRGII